jgi:protein gp37
MAQNSKIEWTHHTANLWWGCTEVHAGCDNCYARVLAHRWGQELWGNDSPRREIKSVWNDLARYQKMAAAAGEMHRVFVGSMMDIFEKPMPTIDSKGYLTKTYKKEYDNTNDLRKRLFSEISEGKFNNLLFLFLTKRPSNINKYIPEAWKTDCPKNVMFGTSPVNQETADKLIPQLLEAPGRKFLSCEPLLGPITLDNYLPIMEPFTANDIDWVIVGGESGHFSRPLHPEWVRLIRDQCISANVPFFFKQWGEYRYTESDGEYKYPDGCMSLAQDKPVLVRKVGKSKSGRILDGNIYNEFPNN